ncbi:hypothetical protein NMY22_g14359 [Coprinellus aureogranulatus]|nr:hypothetical protein NMY22_g14359 [Coprinellus aureogranulatus]
MAQDLNPFSEIRKESLDIYNRLHSIEEDVEFVNSVHDAYPDLPLIRHEHPCILQINRWTLQQLELQLEEIQPTSSFEAICFLARIILVDSTRSGKRIPDALSKTVPIWCAVINRAIQLRNPDITQDGWDNQLYTPADVRQLSGAFPRYPFRLDDWALALATSSFDLPKLSSPLRPFWITPASTSFPKFNTGSEDRKYLPVICVSASKQVQDGTERRIGGFSYIQGSGDDHELWGMGLNPDIFWKEQEKLLSANRAELPGLVSELVSSHSSSSWGSAREPEGIAKISNRISLCRLSELGSRSLETSNAAFVVVDEVSENGRPASSQSKTSPPGQSEAAGAGSTEPQPPPSVLKFEIPGGKRSQTYFLHDVLPSSLRFIGDKLSQGCNIVIACPSAKDLSVGVALGAISRYFDDEGVYAQGRRNVQLTKQSIRTRLEWIIASCPRANPSRTTLKRVNEFLLTAEHLQR